MSGEADYRERLLRILQVVEREAHHLEGVTGRFFGDAQKIDASWLEQRLANPMWIDTLESFAAKFARIQDTIGDKLLPVFLHVAGESPGTAVENLNRAERLGLIRNAQEWLGARGLRNKLVHEYIDDLGVLADALNLAHSLVPVFLGSFRAFENYTHNRLLSGDNNRH